MSSIAALRTDVEEVGLFSEGMAPSAAVYGVAYFVALADGVVKEAELAGIRRFIDALVPAKDRAHLPDEAGLQEMREAIARDRGAFVARLAAAIPERKRRLVAFVIAAATGLVDGELAAAEQEALAEIGAAFELGESTQQLAFGKAMASVR